jgi:hypothetical protein
MEKTGERYELADTLPRGWADEAASRRRFMVIFS